MRIRHLSTLLGGFLALILLVTSCSAASVTNSSVQPTTGTQATSQADPAVPTGELVSALTGFGNENFIPWTSDSQASQICCLIYDCLIYWDEVNQKFIPGLAESWEVSADALTTTFHIRKGVQFSDNWGELTAEDVKFTMAGHASKESRGFTPQARNIASMDTPDPYTLIVTMKTPAPIFYTVFSLGNGGIMQGIACKKYVETVGSKEASQKPIGSGPYKLAETQLGAYYKFAAVENHWRVVPEFKTLTLRAIPEISTVVAMLKNKEVDLANVTAEQLADLKASGVATEASPVGGFLLVVNWGGLCLPIDDRYDAAADNKDPWVDSKVRKAMNLAVDREAICKAVFAGAAVPEAVPLMTADMEKYQYPYDPDAAKQLLTEAGYPNGFSFRFISYTQTGIPETPRVVEAMASYWQQIGLDPKITAIEYAAYNNNNRLPLKTAGDISLAKMPPAADLLERDAVFLMPNYPMAFFQDEGSYAIWKEGSAKITYEERSAYADKLNQYYFDNIGPMVICRTPNCFAWTDKISTPPHAAQSAPTYLEYVRHAQPLNTFRLFSPWPGR